MKEKKTELDVDFIGGMGSLTKEEENKISEFIRARKTKQSRANKKGKVTTRKRERV